MRTRSMQTLSLSVIGLTVLATLAHAQAAPPAKAAPAPAPQASATPAPATASSATPPDTTALAAEAQPASGRSSAEEPQGFTYSPEGRRDPFVSLLTRGAEPRPKSPGVGGLGTSEVSLRGVVTSQGGFVGILQGVDSKNYIVRVGDRLADGTIRTITADSMVILQQVNDPLSLEKQREVRKLLRQTEEAK